MQGSKYVRTHADKLIRLISRADQVGITLLQPHLVENAITEDS